MQLVDRVSFEVFELAELFTFLEVVIASLLVFGQTKNP